MRVFTLGLLILTIIAGFVSYHGLGSLTETMKLTYAYLALSTLACGLITLSIRPQLPRRVAARIQVAGRRYEV
jgi:hypothetical protein